MPFNVQAALGYAQFQRIDELIRIKRWIWETFQNNLSEIKDIKFNPETNNTWQIMGNSISFRKIS